MVGRIGGILRVRLAARLVIIERGVAASQPTDRHHDNKDHAYACKDQFVKRAQRTVRENRDHRLVAFNPASNEVPPIGIEPTHKV
jgi:hypothetical protein